MRTLRTLTAAVAVVALAACAPAPAPEAMTGTAADEQAIRDLIQSYATSWNASDAAGIVAIMAEDYQEVQPDGTHLQGRAAVEAGLAEELAGRPDGVSMSVETTFVRWESADVASVGGAYSLAGLPEDMLPGMPSKGSFLAVVKRTGDGWKVTSSLGAQYIPEPTEG